MTQTELGGDHEDVVILLLVSELLEHRLRLGRLAQTLIVDLAVTVVVELAVPDLLDRVEYLLHRFGVGRSDRLPLRDGEPPFGVLGHLALGELLVGEPDTREDLAQDVALLRDRLGLRVAGEIAVIRGDLFVLELVGDRQFGEGKNGRGVDAANEVGVALHALGTFLAEVVGVGIGLHRLLGSVGGHASDLLHLAIGGRFLSKRRHDVSSLC